ncbi:MAG: GerW family sporulation protein [Clostridia bacterium]|nr:GerW family sporulation protein [Clostridia bacterium]
MPDHPIDGLMKTTLDSIAQMVDVNTILGDPVETPDGNVIMPVSRVTFGFAAGGTDLDSEPRREQPTAQAGSEAGSAQFGGGGGAGISLQPVGFLVVGNSQVRFLPVSGDAVFDRLLDVVPDLIAKMTSGNGKSHTVPLRHDAKPPLS